MLINLSDVFTSEGKVITVTASLEMSRFTSRIGNFLILEKSPVSFTFTNVGIHKAKVEGSVELTFDTRCDRCLSKVPKKLTLNFSRIVLSPDLTADEDSEDDDYLSFMEGYQLNVETFMYNEILINWPMKILCQSDCKGVCPICGKNLNDGTCECDTFVPDPRMAVIKDIFNADKEV